MCWSIGSTEKKRANGGWQGVRLYRDSGVSLGRPERAHEILRQYVEPFNLPSYSEEKGELQPSGQRPHMVIAS